MRHPALSARPSPLPEEIKTHSVNMISFTSFYHSKDHVPLELTQFQKYRTGPSRLFKSFDLIERIIR